LHELECVACPSAGACGGQFTANTMACVSEAIGLALPGSAGAPAPYEERDRFAVASGRAVMELLRLRLRPRDIVTRKALENAATVVAATGGSTNAGCICRRSRMRRASISPARRRPRSCAARRTSPT
jgi:dihydroxy-acid dehydratase